MGVFFKDNKLDYLKSIRDEARQEMYKAKNTRFELGRRCYALHDELDIAYSSQRAAFDAAQVELHEHEAKMSYIREKIAFYEQEARERTLDMAHEYRLAKEAYNAHDGDMAKTCSNAAKVYRKKMQSAKGHVGSLVGDSKKLHQKFETSYIQANLQDVIIRTAKIKAEYAEVSNLLKEAKVQLGEKQNAFDKANQIFYTRLEELRNEERRRKAERDSNHK